MSLSILGKCLAPLTRFAGSSLTPAPAAAYLQPCRTYIKNFYEEGTAVKPPAGWMHKQAGHFQHRWAEKRRIDYKVPSEVRRIRCHGFDNLLKTRGGRKILMHRILRGRDVIAH